MRHISLTPPCPILLTPALVGAWDMLLFSVFLMNSLNKYAPFMISLLLKIVFFFRIYYRKRLRVLSISLEKCKHVIMELPNHCYKPSSTAKLCHTFPKPKCLVDKGQVEDQKDHICCSSVLPESTLTFWYNFSLINLFMQAIQKDVASIFPAIDNTINRCLYGCQRLDMVASLNSCGITSFLYMQCNNPVGFSAIDWPPAS